MIVSDIKLKDIRIRNNEVLITADTYQDTIKLDPAGLILNAQINKGTQKTYQTVVQVGPLARDVNVGDVVEIKPDRYLLRHIQHDRNSIRADIPEGHIKEEFGPDYKFPEIEIDGKKYIRIYDQDIDFVIKSYERI